MHPKPQIDIYLDTADLTLISKAASNPDIAGVTTNPSIVRASGIIDYREYVKQACINIANKPISIAVLSDSGEELEAQARVIASIKEDNVFIKIPCINGAGQSNIKIINRLSADGININITALFTQEQIAQACKALSPNSKGIVSIFAGRIADTGINPSAYIENAVELLSNNDKHQVLWASPREIYNLTEAANAGCHIITLSPALLAKFQLWGLDLETFSRRTVTEFAEDANQMIWKSF